MKNLLTICFATLFFNVAANAEVVDTAGMFSSSAIQTANQKLEDIKRKSGKELVIETIEEVGQADANALAIEKAKARGVNGVYMLVFKKDRKLKIEIGNKTKQVFGDFERDTLRFKITEEFKVKNFDRGLNSSVDYFAEVMDSAVASKNTSNSNYPQRANAPIRTNQTTGGIPWMTIIIFAVIAFIAFKIITSLMGSNRGGAGNMNQPYGATGGYGNSGPGFMGTFLTGMLGAAAGSWLYDKFTGHDSGLYGNDHYNSDSFRNNGESWSQSDTDYSGDSSDSGWGDSGGSDFGGGSDW